MKSFLVLFSIFHVANAFSINHRLSIIPSVSVDVANRYQRSNTICNMAKQKQTNDEFWAAQRKMAASMADSVNDEETAIRA